MALISGAARPVTHRDPATRPTHMGTHAPKPAGRTQLGNENKVEIAEREGREIKPTVEGESRHQPTSVKREDLRKGGQLLQSDTQATALKPASSDAMCPPRISADSGTPSKAQDGVHSHVQDGSTQLRSFKAFGIDAYPSLALKKEICIDFINRGRWCPYSTQCYRIHPRDKKMYLRLLLEGKSQDLFHQEDISQTPRASGSYEELAPYPSPKSDILSTERPTSHPISLTLRRRPHCPNRNDFGWDPATGHWNFHLNQEAWLSEDSSSTDSSIDFSPHRRELLRSCHSSDTEEDTSTLKHKSVLSTTTAQPELCRNFLKGACTLGASCRFYHGIQGMQDAVGLKIQGVCSPPLPAQPPRFRGAHHVHPTIPSGICLLSLQGRCMRGTTCRFQHPNILSGNTSASPLNRMARVASESRYQRPPFNETCRHWLRGDCQKGHLCNYVHGDLTYDETKPARNFIQVPARTSPEVFSTIIYKHIKIKVTEGFEIVEVVTGFETSWIYIGNVPRRINNEQLASFLRTHGELIDLRIPDGPTGPFVVVKARFVDAAEASKVCSIVDGLEAFGSTLTAKLSISVNNDARTHLNDTSVRIQWEAPSKTGYTGFTTKESFQNAMEKARSTALDKHLLKVTIHNGLPAVSRFNLRVDAVPAAVDTDRLKAFLGADGIMWGKTNYTSEVKARNGIQKMVKESGADVLEFDVMPPPFKSGMIVAWAHLATSVDAKKLCDYMHARKPHFTGNTRIFARHIQSLEYTLPREVYELSRKDIEALAASAWRMGHLSVAPRVHANHVVIRLGADDTQGLSKLKAELDVILSGEIVREKGKVVWDRFFARPAGQEFATELQRKYAPLTVQIDKYRKHVRLFGASTGRLAARMDIMEKVQELQKQSVHTITLDSQLLGTFVNDGLSQVSKDLGDDCVQLDLWERALIVRGDQHAYNAVLDAVIRTRRSLRSEPLPCIAQCPVCFEEASALVTLCCGHSWCKTCIIRYMMTAIDQKLFPLTCLGDDAKCGEKIPLSCAKQILPPADFEALIEASFSAYVHRHPYEFSYCPTPDCQQIYRHLPRIDVSRPPISKGQTQKPPTSRTTASVSVGAVLQCPSCLIRICASCQTEAHDGLACVRPDEGDGLFEEWMKNNDVKPCPGCKMPIEKAMGCHHVTCTVCSIHLCWVCLTPFHNGAGVYSHMLAIHGSFV